MIKKLVSRIIPTRIKKQLKNFKILAFDYAQYKTIRDRDCVDSNNHKIPWYTYPTIEYLNNIDFSQKSIFEYGSGNSSIYWSNKAKEVISVEHDKVWYEKVKLNFSNNQTILLTGTDTDYEGSIIELEKKFDVIIIDGIRRIECSKIIDKFLNKDSNEGYIVILDNSDWHRDTAKYLRVNLDLIEIDFHGYGPINNYTWTTSLFVSRNFNFKPLKNIQPNFSVAAIHQSEE